MRLHRRCGDTKFGSDPCGAASHRHHPEHLTLAGSEHRPTPRELPWLMVLINRRKHQNRQVPARLDVGGRAVLHSHPLTVRHHELEGPLLHPFTDECSPEWLNM